VDFVAFINFAGGFRFSQTCVTWPGGRVRNDHIFGIPVAILPIYYTTFWCYDVD